MATISLSNPVNHTTADANLIAANNAALQTAINGGLDSTNLAPGLLTPIGSMVDYAGSTDPNTSWLLCDGRSLVRATYPDLFTAIGTTYGSADGTHFNIPDLRGRTSVMVDGAAGRLTANDALGNSSGEEKHVLVVAELAAHSHVLQYNTRFVSANDSLGT